MATARDWVFFWAFFLAFLAALGLMGAVALGAPAEDQRAKVREANQALNRANTLYGAKKYSEAGAAIEEAQKAFTALTEGKDDRETGRIVAPIYKRLKKLHGLLELESVKLTPLPKLASLEGKGDKPAGKKDDVSFSTQVAPILIARCGGCHVDKNKGGLSMASYASLRKGAKDNVEVINPGKGKDSLMIESIESGDMPKGGGKVPPEELALLVRWIDKGATFDGPDPSAPLASLSGGKPGMPDAKAMPEVARATGKEEVLFSRDVGPILLEHCFQCHGEQNPPMGFSMATFKRMMRGGRNGAPITPGKPEESLLIKKLRPKPPVGARMPLRNPPLSDDQIDKIALWIKLSAKFDGLAPDEPLELTVAAGAANRASHEELAGKRAELAARNWRSALPDVTPTKVETKNFLIYGVGGEGHLHDVGELAEQQATRVAKALKVPLDAQGATPPLLKGRLTIYVFDKHYDYSEIGERLEKRTIPSSAVGHFTYTRADAYACVVEPRDKEYSLAALLIEQIAAARVASLGTAPHWFAVGVGRALAEKLDPKDARVKSWDSQIPTALEESNNPASFMRGGPTPEAADVLSYGFVKSLMAASGKYNSLLAGLGEGQDFDQAFQKIYGAEAKDAAVAWSKNFRSHAR